LGRGALLPLIIDIQRVQDTIANECRTCSPSAATQPCLTEKAAVQADLIKNLVRLCACEPKLPAARVEAWSSPQPDEVDIVATILFGINRHIHVSLLPHLAPENAVVAALQAHSRCLRRRGFWAQEMVVVPRLPSGHPIVLTRRVGLANLDDQVLLECLRTLANS